MTKLSFVPLLFCLHLILWVSEHLRKPYVSIFASRIYMKFPFLFSAPFQLSTLFSHLHQDIWFGSRANRCLPLCQEISLDSLCSITILPLNSSDLFNGMLPLVFPVPVAGLISRHWGEAERCEQLEILISLLQEWWSTALIKWPKASPGHTSKRSFSGASLLNGFARVTKATSRDVIDFWKM